ncbi:hypothetical protein GA0115257_109155 [Streptomyces sp. LcepLS]|nr:hypothetical protein GA0115257_109155 [Streptomyces sp. LcepLS]
MPLRPPITVFMAKNVFAPARLMTVRPLTAGTSLMSRMPLIPMVKPLAPGMKCSPAPLIFSPLSPLRPRSQLPEAANTSSKPSVRRVSEPSELAPEKRFPAPLKAPAPSPLSPFHRSPRRMPFVVGAITPMIESTRSVMLALPCEKSIAVLMSSATFRPIAKSASGPPTIIAGMMRMSASQPSAFQNSSHSSIGEAMLYAASVIVSDAVLAAALSWLFASSAIPFCSSRPASSSSSSAAAAVSASSARFCCVRMTSTYVRSAPWTSLCACRNEETYLRRSPSIFLRSASAVSPTKMPSVVLSTEVRPSSIVSASETRFSCEEMTSSMRSASPGVGSPPSPSALQSEGRGMGRAPSSTARSGLPSGLSVTGREGPLTCPRTSAPKGSAGFPGTR